MTTKTTKTKNFPLQIVAVIAIACLAIGAIGMFGLAQTGVFTLTTPTTQTDLTQLENKIIEFLNLNYEVNGGTGITSEITEITEHESGVYEVLYTIFQDNIAQGNGILYASKDGEYIYAGQAINLEDAIEQIKEALNQSQETTELQKTDKPVVELFVMSYCPYGIQMEEAILPVVQAFDNKIDFQLKFVDYLMHGEKEGLENTRQRCIDNQNKLVEYLDCFIENTDSDACILETNINTTELDACMQELDTEYKITENINSGEQYPAYIIDTEDNSKYSVQGSPTLIINGTKVSVSRTPQALADVLCNAFTDTPSECNLDFSDTGSTSTGSCS